MAFDDAKKWAKKLSDILEAGDVSNVGTMSYWSFVKEFWENLKEAMGE